MANQVGGTGEAAVFGQDSNHVTLIDHNGQTEWPAASKTEIAEKLVWKIEAWFHDHKR